MLGMDKMLSQMIGMTPEQMRELAEGLSKGATKAFADIARMGEQLADISARLERIENGGNQP